MRIKAVVKHHLEDIVASAISFLISLLFLLESPLHPWITGAAGTDSSVFKTIAFMMENGYMPYRDSFDHKGPFLFFLNYIGDEISYYHGIWIIEVVALTVTIFLIYKITRLLCKPLPSVISTFLSLSMLFEYFEGGNFTEEYAMPCIAYSIFVFLDFLINHKLTKLRILVAGISLGVVLMLRPNMTAVWVAFCLFIFFSLLIRKEYKKLLRITTCFAMGVLVVIIPIVIWLGINDAIVSCWNDYIVFNQQYISVEGGRALFSAKLEAFFVFSSSTTYIAGLFGLLLGARIIENKGVLLAYLLYYILTVVFMVLSGMHYGHYGMILVPAYAFPLSMIFAFVEKVRTDSIKNVLWLIVGIYCSSIIPKWIELINSIPTVFESRYENDVDKDSDIRTPVYYIKNNTDENDLISVYGNWDIIYVLSRRKHATRYSYQFPIGEVMPEIMNDYFYQLQEQLPKVIVIQAGFLDDKISSFLKVNGYSMAWKADENDKMSAAMYSLE